MSSNGGKRKRRIKKKNLPAADESLYIKSPSKPFVSEDQDLRDLVNIIYYANALVGETLGDAVRFELLTSEQVKGKNHVKKGQLILKALNNWLEKRKNRDSPDRPIAILLYNDLADALQIEIWREE
jgi:hypothetical protein